MCAASETSSSFEIFRQTEVPECVRQGTFSLEAEEGWCGWSSIPHTRDYLKGLGFLTNATPGEPQFLHNCPFWANTITIIHFLTSTF